MQPFAGPPSHQLPSQVQSSNTFTRYPVTPNTLQMWPEHAASPSPSHSLPTLSEWGHHPHPPPPRPPPPPPQQQQHPYPPVAHSLLPGHALPQTALSNGTLFNNTPQQPQWTAAPVVNQTQYFSQAPRDLTGGPVFALHHEQSYATGPPVTPVISPPQYTNRPLEAVDMNTVKDAHHLAMQNLPSPPPPAIPPRIMTTDQPPEVCTPPPIPPKLFEQPLHTAATLHQKPLFSLDSSLPYLQDPARDVKGGFPPESHPSIETSSVSKDPPPPPQYLPPGELKTISSHSRTQSAEDIARAIQLSLAEAEDNSHIERARDEEEERNLRLALANSLGESPSPECVESTVEKDDHEGNTPVDQAPAPAASASAAVDGADYDAEAKGKGVDDGEDAEAAIRRLMEEEERRWTEERDEMERRDEELARQQAKNEAEALEERADQERKDAEMARILAGNNEAAPQQVIPALANTVPALQRTPHRLSDPLAPQSPPGSSQSDNTMNPSAVMVSNEDGRPSSMASSITPQSQFPDASVLRGRPTSPVTNAMSVEQRPQFSRTLSAGAGTADTSSKPAASASRTKSLSSPPNRPRASSGDISLPRPSDVPNVPPLPLHAAEPVPSPEEGPGMQDLSPTNDAPIANTSANAAVPRGPEIELLRGVSFGFDPPNIRVLACPPLPDIVVLRLAPSPCFHIVALSWRHLLRLLAQFETRLEASVDVIAKGKDCKLRVVIQFVKIPRTENEWRTIIHLSIDQPVPAETPNAARYTFGDTTVLPYSVALGTTPAHFKISPGSQVYTVPRSQSTPFPTLPLTLPNLALYLQSAMRDSKSGKTQIDTSNSRRRLARMVTTYYPDEVSTDNVNESGRGVGGLLKRVVGRGAKRKDDHGNEEVYDMVTPFRIDKYTTIA